MLVHLIPAENDKVFT